MPTLLTGFGWGLAVIAVGFWLRLLFGPRISPLAVLSVKVLTPRLGKTRLVPGPPKRFAQGIGAAVSTAAAVLLAVGLAPAGWLLALDNVDDLVVARNCLPWGGHEWFSRQKDEEPKVKVP